MSALDSESDPGAQRPTSRDAVRLPGEVSEQLPLPLPGQLERPSAGISIPREDRVFSNRNLRMSKIDWIGFDMDYTLAIYRQEAMDSLSVKLTAERLVERGYPRFLEHLQFDTRFPIRGLLVDRKHGNVLKMDRHKFVSKGYHGTRRLDGEELNRLYHHKKVRPTSRRYHWIDTLFALCEVTSYAAIVTALEERHVTYDPKKLFSDVRDSIDEAHADGAVYSTVRAAMEDYIERDPALPRALHKLRSAGKRLFLLTNSPYHYTTDVMSHLLDGQVPHYDRWRQYFDVIICSAKKPAWFAAGTPLLVREDSRPATEPASQPAPSLEKGRIYEGGGISEFEDHLGVEGGRVLYVGDHIYGDILRSKKDTTWRTAMIIQELDQELLALEKTVQLRMRRRQLHEARPLYEDELRFYSHAHKRAARQGGTDADRLLAERARSHVERVRAELCSLEQEYEALGESLDSAFHPYFGSLLKEMNGLSLFGQQIELYADIYMRRVSCLGAYSPMQFFRSPHDLMPHEL